jgi:uncharacterized protein (TIGR04222 family)
MNPFELPGPQFILFFIVVGTLLMGGLIWVRRAAEPDPAVTVRLPDPYAIAALRGGPAEVLRLATTGLIDRGLLEVEGDRLKAAQNGQAQMIRNPLERSILDHFRLGDSAKSMFSGGLRREAAFYERALQELGLVWDRDARMQQILTCLGAVGVMWIISVTKMEMARQRGYPYGYLLMLTFLFSACALALSFVRRTRRGEHFLRDMKVLFEPLRQRASTFVTNSNTNELLLMGAVFGITALPTLTYPYVKTLFGQANQSSCGTVSSCGSSDGGGGGGCGGGCGGCGS